MKWKHFFKQISIPNHVDVLKGRCRDLQWNLFSEFLTNVDFLETFF